MRTFAKLYETEERGQILMVLDRSEPEIRISVDPGDPLAVCTAAIEFTADDGYDKAVFAFETMTPERAIELAEGMIFATTDKLLAEEA